MMGRLVHTGLGSSSLVTCHPLSSPHANSFVIGPGEPERVLFIGTEFLVFSTPPCIHQPGPRVRVLGVCGRV